MDGILLIDKPEKITSNHLVNKVKKHLRNLTGEKIKVGHTGTLDFFASGLMIITVGKGTRLTEYLQKLDKEYIATGELGKITDTYDIQGKIIEERDCKIKKDELEKIILSFQKEYYQIPPKFSSKRINGKRAYQLAKKGIEVQLKPKLVKIYNVEIIEIKIPFFTVKIHCSSGTYIRSIIKEIGDQANCGAYTVSLRRTKIGKFDVKESLSLDLFLSLNLEEVKEKLINLRDSLYFLPEIKIDNNNKIRFIKGQKISADLPHHNLAKILDYDNNFLGLGKIDRKGVLQPVKVFV
ncbi:tRNA pseudouridine(55) synthase TruB [Persephonella sp.]